MKIFITIRAIALILTLTELCLAETAAEIPPKSPLTQVRELPKKLLSKIKDKYGRTKKFFKDSKIQDFLKSALLEHTSKIAIANSLISTSALLLTIKNTYTSNQEFKKLRRDDPTPPPLPPRDHDPRPLPPLPSRRNNPRPLPRPPIRNPEHLKKIFQEIRSTSSSELRVSAQLPPIQKTPPTETMPQRQQRQIREEMDKRRRLIAPIETDATQGQSKQLDDEWD